jgi:outer membrane protein OmpA-like peptidoglycan-associated protein/tetratricopeptide (TPR) repeat protein
MKIFRNTFLVLFCLLPIANCLFAQYDPFKINKKATSLYAQALEKAQGGNFREAINLLNQSVTIDSKYVDAYLSLGGIYGEVKNYKSSIENYEKAFALDSNYTYEYKLPYSINLAGQGRFEDALAVINSLLSREKLAPATRRAGEYRKKTYEFAVDYSKKNPPANYVFAPKNLGDGVNTAAAEYFPSLTIDGEELVFTRRSGYSGEDFYYSRKKLNEWDTAKPMEGNINTNQNEAAQNISLDGKWLVFDACGRRDGFGSCDIYISYLTPQGWSEAINPGGRINSEQWDAQPCFSPDKRDLYFSSARPGGYGGKDIYVCHVQPNGKWGEAENLGPSVNTSGDEQCPFIHADNQTLYFTSNYWPGYGDDDLFYTRKQPDGKWSEPVNLGYPINTINREGTLFITADGKTAYYAANRSDSRGDLDIYSFELRQDVRPYKTLWVKGNVFDKKTLKGLPSSVELIDLASKQFISKVQTDENGNYLITLPVGKDYAFNVNRKGYLFYSDNFLLSQGAPDSVYRKNIPLQPIEVNASIVLNNIFFETKKFDLDPKSQAELDKVIQLLNDNPGLKIEISGHTDNVGKPADNLMLSNNRAKAVVNYLISKGVTTQRLVAKGYGETKPVSDNKTDEGRARNRRTELRVISR